MKAVTFQNQGLIDLLAIKAFGVSAKESANPIGYFGTGLKYALAVCLREGQNVTLFRGRARHEFAVKRMRVRGTDFDFVALDGEPLGFTTALGKNWKLWQAFRELYCNMLDESGTCSEDIVPGAKGMTTFVVEGAGFHEQYLDRHSIVLEGQPWLDLGSIKVHDRPGQHVYYRGVRVHTLSCPSLRTYNITRDLMLTEDRTLAGGELIASQILRDAALFSCPNREFLQEVVLAPANTFEKGLAWDESYSPVSPLMLEVIHSLGNDPRLSHSASNLLRKKRGEQGFEPRPVVLTQAEVNELDEAQDLAVAVGYAVRDYDVTVTDELPDHVLGQADTVRKKIFLNRLTFNQGLRRLAGTLVEEYIHLHYALPDECRAMQNHLIDALVAAAHRLVEAQEPPTPQQLDRGTLKRQAHAVNPNLCGPECGCVIQHVPRLSRHDEDLPF